MRVLPALKADFPHIKYIIAGKADDLEKERLAALINENSLEGT
jgi:hypothetical protein